MKHLLLFFSFFSISFLMEAQVTQSIRGKVVDKQSKFPIYGATVVILTTVPQQSVDTDEQGEFTLREIPIGRHDLKISLFGYKETFLSNILLTSGKEAILNVELEEEIVEMEEVVIEGKDKAKTNNEMSAVSNRTFSIEETKRYAGSLNDPARMAKNFAGVSGTNDSRNDIIIRGNSPLGVLWRLEGLDIPSPNHFGTFGTTGGPISMLNNNVLSNSDFMTGAWPSPYGNALAGVFDLQMRKGNNQKREYMAQFGFNGLEIGLEGPFSKKSGASYLANYRYSTLGIFKTLGINFGTSALPQYQDLNFKLHFPTEKAGTFTVFGLGGLSHVQIQGQEVDTTDLYSDIGDNTFVKTNTGVLGITNTFFHNNTTYSRIGLAVSGTITYVTNDSMPRQNGKFLGGSPVPDYRNEFSLVKYSLNYTLNKKFNAKNNLTSGLIADLYDFHLVDSMLNTNTGKFVTLRNFTGSSMLLQAYSNWQHRFNEKITLNTGLHFQHFTFNQTSSIEPRLGIRYQFMPRQTISFGYGLHSQLQAFQAYFREDQLADGSYVRTNKDLDFTRSHQFVLGYDHSLSKNLRLKVETYYQYVFNAPVERRPSSFSMLNSGADFVIVTSDSMVNKGTGRNYGLELTFEKFYSNQYYFLFTASLYDSKYKGSDGVLRNTAFNGHYTFNALAGKEFKISARSTVILDLKVTWAGGRRFTPIDLTTSQAANVEVRDDSKAYSEQLPDYFRPDVKISYRLEGKRITHEWAFDVQNVINRKNAFIKKYNVDKRRVVVVPQIGLFPVFQYRVTF